MQQIFEISDRYNDPGQADGLLYEPIGSEVTFRHTRSYEVEYEGNRKKLRKFVEKTLRDSISQELHEGESPALDGFSFVLEYGMKPGALDLEKESIVSYYRGIEEAGFELVDLRIRQRIYLFGGKREDSERFVRDICNAAIHQWNVIHSDAA
ncbi:MAG: hypothetical protein AAGA96_19950 [Verrucomicrobiota bacterium]